MAEDGEKKITSGLQVGDYVLGEIIARGTQTSLWDATQLSVRRQVLLCVADEALADDIALREGFLADVRAKASVDHPLISSVLEAVDESHCFYALEKLHGNTLGDLHERGESISPLHVVRVLRNIASAYIYLEDHTIAWLPISPDDVFIDDKYHCRITNLAVSGDADPDIAKRDKHLLGQLLQDLLEPGQPGSTRTGSLLDYMADLDREKPLTWKQIHDLADEVERQLAEPRGSEQIQSPTMRMRPTASAGSIVKILAGIVIGALLAGVIYYFVNREQTSVQRALPGMVRIAAGKHPGPDGFPVQLPEYWISAHEVTIGEYAKFLEALSLLRDENKTVFQHEDQPAEKTSHEPDDWQQLYEAAKISGRWNQRKIDLNYPVVGIDWWDAYAYAEWKGHRLPSREEWYAAASSTDKPGDMKPSGWNAVDKANITTSGIYGLAGNVSEWTRKRSLNPADPTQPARYVICGASYLKPKFGVRAREWVDDRNLRRPDLGFRTMSTTPQEN